MEFHVSYSPVTPLLVRVFFPKLALDCETSGVSGAKEAQWCVAPQRLDVRLAWSPLVRGGAFAGKQVEPIARADVELLLRRR